MPIATPQGTLDFKSVDKVTFVGASSNTVIDTTTGSLGVGVGVGGPTSNLHVVGNTRLEGDINMLHTSNTAAIKLNSNVVTEFPRSKKLIKYPRVALTSAASTTSGYQGYKVTRSNEHSSYQEWEAFDGMPGDGVGWYSGGSTGTEYNGTGGIYNGNTRLATETELGEWLGLELPEFIKLQYLRLVSQSYSPITNTIDDFILYAKKQSGDTWTSLGLFTGKAPAQTSPSGVIVNIDANDYYKFFAIVARKSAISSLGVSIRELEYYGVPEYDPDAHGTDVTIKSKANVPNTDWLEVYYDAKNYTNGVVQDETVNNRDGTLYGDTSLSSADGIHKFDFDGNGDYIKTTLTGFTGTTVTFSAWVFMDSIDTSRPNTIMGLGNWGSTGSAAWIAVGSGGNLETGNNGIASCGGSVQATTLTKRWLHITGIVSSGDFRFYQDGQLIKSLTTTGTINYGTNPVLYIATRADSSGNPEATRYFDCKIANARLFNRALTTDEIYQLYAYQKEEFGHSTNSLTLKGGRLGIGTSEPRAMLDVKGDTFSKVYKGGRTTFLTWDYVGQRYVDITPPANNNSYANVANILDHTFDIPSCYHNLGRANLKAFVQIDWRGEVNKPWNFVFRIEVHYNGDQIAYSSSSDHAASYNNRGCGIPTVGYHGDDHYSTPEAASVTSLFKLNDCDVSPGSTLKVQLVGQWGDTSNSQRVWTGRTAGNLDRPDYELPTSSFFVVLDVDDGY